MMTQGMMAGMTLIWIYRSQLIDHRMEVREWSERPVILEEYYTADRILYSR